MNPAKITIAPWMNKFAAQSALTELTPEQADKARKARAAREASKLSTGPRTDTGKAISSLNARKHGFSGARIVVDDEDQPAYDAHLDAYHQSLEPANQIEADTVRLAANAMWRIDRLTSIESGLLELEMGHHCPHIDAKLQNLTVAHYMAIAFREQTIGNNASDLCRRYLSSAQRDFQRAVDLLSKLKDNRVSVVPIVEDPAPEGIHIVTTPNELAPQTIKAPDITQKSVPAANKTTTSSNLLSRPGQKRRKNRR